MFVSLPAGSIQGRMMVSEQLKQWFSNFLETSLIVKMNSTDLLSLDLFPESYFKKRIIFFETMELSIPGISTDGTH